MFPMMLPTRFLAAALCAALLPVAADCAAQAKADLKGAEKIVQARCSICHGMEGESASPVFPRLAGQHPEYIAKQLADFKTGRRKGAMNEQAQGLSESDIKSLGAYFGQKKPKAQNVADPDLAAVGRYIYLKGNSFSGVAACASCHGAKGEGTVQLPRLAGQHAAYLQSQLKEFNTRERNNDNAVMHTIASRLTELEIRAVSVYLSGQL
jgi:cytochrome c553